MADGGIQPIEGVTLKDSVDADADEGPKKAQRDRLLEAVLRAGVTFWQDADGIAYATVPAGDSMGLQRYRVRSRRFGLLVRDLYGRANQHAVGGKLIIPGSVSDTALAESLPALEAIAMRGPVCEPDVRACRWHGALWLDLGGPDWRLVRIVPEGWRVIDGADVPLIRPDGLRPLPLPQPVAKAQRSAALDDLRELLNIAPDRAADFMLVVAWLVAALHPSGPYPVLALDGEQGSGKSTACRMLRRLVDPNKADLRAPPRNEDDLIVAALSARVVALDNVSFIEAETADALCRLATGAGLSKRRLYSDGDEHLVSVCRPVLLNGIPSLLARGDLADRALAITLPTIPDSKRRPEAAVWEAFEAAAPTILGLLLDALARALADGPGLHLPRLPRMADFARLACAAAAAFGWTADAMLAAIEDTAAVRIAMTVVAPGAGTGRLLTVTREKAGDLPDVTMTETEGVVNADLTVGASPADARSLRANERVCSPGVKLHGAGFIVTPSMALILGLGRIPGLDRHIRRYLNGKDMTGRSRGVMIVDLFGLTADDVRTRFPEVFQHLLLNVKPERDVKRDDGPDSAAYARLWWLHGKPRPELRTALNGLPRYIVTGATAKHRIFTFISTSVLPDDALICIASPESWVLGVLSSTQHATWALAAGSRLGFGNDPRYNKTRCFDPFPFPAATPAQQAAIGHVAEALDQHRAARLTAHPQLTLTGLYNVLDALRARRTLTDAERDILDAGQVATMQHLHDELDDAVAAAYGWPANLPAADVVARVVALNRERLAEEAAGQVRWLRPEYQAPAELPRRVEQAVMDVDEAATLPAWPKAIPAQYVALRAALARGTPSAPADLARQFRGVRPGKLAPMLQTLTVLGQARDAGDGRYVA